MLGDLPSIFCFLSQFYFEFYFQTITPAGVISFVPKMIFEVCGMSRVTVADE